MGLPEESLEDVRDTLEQIMQLKPDLGSVGVGAEHTAGHQDLDGRLLNVHGADLAAGSLGTQQELLRQVEGANCATSSSGSWS